MEEPRTLCEETFLCSVPEVVTHFLFDFGRSHTLCFLIQKGKKKKDNTTGGKYFQRFTANLLIVVSSLLKYLDI